MDLALALFQTLKANGARDILVVTRETDTKVIEFWQSVDDINNNVKVMTVPHYDITDRHNMEQIAMKRSLVFEHARKFNYDWVWFVDSDIIPAPGTLKELLKTTKDVCLAPYRVKWTDGRVCVGVADKEPPFIRIHDIMHDQDNVARERAPCISGGFGCTLIRRTAFSIPVEYARLVHNDDWCEGEDLGFFLNCHRAGLQVEYLTYSPFSHPYAPHYYDRHV